MMEAVNVGQFLPDYRAQKPEDSHVCYFVVLPQTAVYFIILHLMLFRLSGYVLDDRANQVRSPAEAKEFSSNLWVQTGSGAHPTSCPMGIGGSFSGCKARPGRDADHSSPSLAEVVNEYELYLLSPLESS
jgi:hypothetical protein